MLVAEVGVHNRGGGVEVRMGWCRFPQIEMRTDTTSENTAHASTHSRDHHAISIQDRDRTRQFNEPSRTKRTGTKARLTQVPGRARSIHRVAPPQG